MPVEIELRVQLFGGGSVVAFEFPDGEGPAAAILMNGERFERVNSDQRTLLNEERD